MGHQNYYTLRIRICDDRNVSLEIHDTANILTGEPAGVFRLGKKVLQKIKTLHEAAQKDELRGEAVKELGELLYDALFDDGLKLEFLNLYRKAQQEDTLLRLELDIDERSLPHVAALPWEFMYIPVTEKQGNLWPATAPRMVFSRRRKHWYVPQSIPLQPGEHLRIGIAVAAPVDLGPVAFQPIITQLKKASRSERFEIIDVVESAGRESIAALLGKKPHIFHFIGHGRLLDEKHPESGEIALVNRVDQAKWETPADFSELFNSHKPGLVVLQACESGALSPVHAFAGIASHIVQMGIPAVAAMQYKVSNVTAQRFALQFYRSQADEVPVDQAVQEARRALALGPSGYQSRDFATPVLFMALVKGQVFTRCVDMTAEEKRAKTSEWVKSARRMEDNGSFAEAIKTWKDIRDLEPGYPGLESTLTRLRNALENQEKITELQEALSHRKSDLGAVYFQVAKTLKQMAKKGLDITGDLEIETVKELISGNLPAREFIDYWQNENRRSDSPARPDYEILADSLRRGELIPFIGANFLHQSGLAVLSSREVVRQMAENAGYVNFNGTLPMISQYYLTEKKYPWSKLVETVTGVVEQALTAREGAYFYDILARLEKPLLLISTAYDQGLEAAFNEKGKKYVVVSHNIGSISSPQPGNLVLKYPGNPGQEKVCNIDDLSKEKPLENGYSLIYRLCGCTGSSPAAENPLLILENDFFTFSRRLGHLIPEYISGKFSLSGFLFMGYDLEEWQHRLIANALLDKRAHSSVSCFAVCQAPSPYDRVFWKSHHVDFYDIDLKTFTTRLNEGIGEGV